MRKSVRIGGAGGFWGDSIYAMAQLVRQGNVDYLIADYLAELTLAIMAKQKKRDPNAGYATDFVNLALHSVLHEVVDRKIRIVTNAGGINPRACADALKEMARQQGVDIKIGLVEGDDLMAAEAHLRRGGVTEMFTGQPLPKEIVSMNAYLGAFPIAAALDAGADIVITGRCADSALALGALIHEYGWGVDDYDLLAAGSMAGHLIECGTQATGGLFTDWRSVPGRSEIGYPIAECFPDGTFHLCKPVDTGGLIAPLVAIEQLLYEVGDPRNYLLPDVVCDITDVRVDAVNCEAVAISGVRGRAPSPTFKVSATYVDGYRSAATLTIVGKDAREKALHSGEAIIERTRRLLAQGNLGDFSETNIEVLGSEASTFGDNARQLNPREVVLRVSVRHPMREALELFAREIAPFGTAGTPGTTGFGGRTKPQAVFRLFSFLVDKDEVAVTITVNGDAVPYKLQRPAHAFTYASSPEVGTAYPGDKGESVRVSLRQIAVARSGDKADISHLAVIARSPEHYPALLRDLTTDSVKHYFSHLVRGDVERFELPGTSSLIFTMREALGGGGTASLRSDSLGKAFAEIALDMEVCLPAQKEAQH